jgi:Glycosyl hydrolase 36 superfamily, catalytic domain/Glycosyltransferase family 36
MDNCGAPARSRSGLTLPRRCLVAAATACAIAGSFAAAAVAAAPSGSNIASSRGSGVFGTWTTDSHGMPAYDYKLDEATDPRAQQPELDGDTKNWSQLGNDAIVANAYNHGYVQLWSSARIYQWANRYDAGADHFAGGFGYLRLADGRTASTLYSDRPPASHFQRRFGAGYVRKRMRFAGLDVSETTTAPFGDDPALVDEVKITNDSSEAQRLAWWEYWDVNPYDQRNDSERGLESPQSDGDGLITVAQKPSSADDDPLSIFLAAPGAKLSGFEADTSAFFGSGSRAAPEAVTADSATETTAPPSADGEAGRAMFATRTPLRIRPGRSVTLRFVYGIAHPAEIDAVVRRATRPDDTAAASAGKWARWLPSVNLGDRYRWLARELTWDAYMTRSSSLYEEACGHHVITQGGYYQYATGAQEAYRDPLQHLLPMIYADPALAKDVLIYSLQQQAAGTGDVSYGMASMCEPLDLGTSNDFDFWLIQAVADYVLATRDTDFLDRRIPYLDRRSGGSVWSHLKLAVQHQESPPLGLGPDGNYLMGTAGDWSDFSSAIFPATESVLVTAQLAYAYPQLARVAQLRGDGRFARRLDRLGERDLEQTRSEWTDRGWFARGYYNGDRVGGGAEYLEPQPWAILAGAAGKRRARTLVSRTDRLLLGRGAPPELHGPTRIGASQSPAAADPEVTEFDSVNGVGDGNAVFVGGSWYALNGPLVWALGNLVGEVPNAAERAFDELKRNTLTAHAVAFPDHWSGVLNVDDACNSFYSSAPEQCGIALLLNLADRDYNGQITHQPAWGLMSALHLAGIEPGRRGYSFAPVLPLRRFSIRLPEVGIAATPRTMSGYVRTKTRAPLRLRLDPPGKLRPAATVRIDGEPVRARFSHGTATVTARPGRDHRVRWTIDTKGTGHG